MFVFYLIYISREIIGYSAGRKKDAELVYKAFTTVNPGLNKIKIFHTDRGNEFKNKIIDELLNAFNIERSLSKKGVHMITLSQKQHLKYLRLSSLLIEDLIHLRN
jgi:hypothetical protein